MIIEAHDLADDPQHGSRKECLNCGEQIFGRYCHACGQHIGEHNQGIWQIVQEFLEEFIRFDSKFLRTILPLIFKPGFLTKQWLAGKRVRYITPLKLYVSLSALCFLVISLTSHPGVVQIGDGSNQSLESTHKAMSEEALKSKSPLERMIIKPISKLMSGDDNGARNFKEVNEKIIGRLSTVNLILLPIFALLFKLLYIRRGRYYVEHLVFALHFYAFFALATTLILLITQVDKIELLIVPIAVWLLAYLPVAMIVNYRQGIIKTFVKCWIFCSVYLVTVGIVLLAVVFVTTNEVAAGVQVLKEVPAATGKPAVPIAPGTSEARLAPTKT